MKFKEMRMQSFVNRGNALIAQGKTEEAMKLVTRGLQTYSERALRAVTPYAKADAGLVSLCLRHIADEIEKNNEGAKELREGLWNIVGRPTISEIEKIRKPNQK